MPMRYSSIEGTHEVFGDKVHIDRLDSRTLERGHTKTFAYLVWVWDMAFIPTKHTYWKLPRGTGHVEEMEAVWYDLFIHVDRMEVWTPRPPRSSHSAQSGIPFSGSDDVDGPLCTYPGTWTMHIEDGQCKERHKRQARTRDAGDCPWAAPDVTTTTAVPARSPGRTCSRVMVAAHTLRQRSLPRSTSHVATPQLAIAQADPRARGPGASVQWP
ncbi:d-3-phosphoglycerate chloroplastic [Hordeum vulgare]|nr:d-3-phosphoglycerate chloroplastic [Hordeum vulgare]